MRLWTNVENKAEESTLYGGGTKDARLMRRPLILSQHSHDSPILQASCRSHTFPTPPVVPGPLVQPKIAPRRSTFDMQIDDIWLKALLQSSGHSVKHQNTVYVVRLIDSFDVGEPPSVAWRSDVVLLPSDPHRCSCTLPHQADIIGWQPYKTIGSKS